MAAATMTQPITSTDMPAVTQTVRGVPPLHTSFTRDTTSPVDTGSTSPTAMRKPPSVVSNSQVLAKDTREAAMSTRALQAKEEFEDELHSKVPESPVVSEGTAGRSTWSLFG